MVIEKVINNNIISAKDADGTELVVMGRGIGFCKKPGSIIPDSDIEKVFRLENTDDSEKFKKLLASFPIEYVRLSNRIISYAKETLGVGLNQNVYLTLTDHISFAVKRNKEGMIFSNALYDEVKLFYPREYMVGNHALYLIEDETGCKLPEDEAAAIAIHIINAELNFEISSTYLIIKMMREMMEIIESEIKISGKSDYPRDILITNIKHLAKRLLCEEPLQGRCDLEFYHFVESNYPNEYRLIEKIGRNIEKAYGCFMTEEEKIYLTLHVKRMNDLYAL